MGNGWEVLLEGHAALVQHDDDHVHVSGRNMDVNINVNSDQLSTVRAPEVHLQVATQAQTHGQIYTETL